MKILTIALKDTLIRFRDRNAILMMIAAPMLIAIVMGAAFGGQGGNTSPISEIPIIVVNADTGELGQTFVDAITNIDVETVDGDKGLFTVSEMDSRTTAIEQVELGEVRGAVYIPADFSEKLKSVGAQLEAARIEVFTDPVANVSPGIIRGVTARIANSFNTVVIANDVVASQLFASLENASEPPSADVLANLENLEATLTEENRALTETEGARARITLAPEFVGESEEFNLLNYFVPSMSIFFLMFTVFDGTRSILEEERDGTLHRLMTTPTSRAQILLGKIGGTFLTGLVQFAVLVTISGVFFGVDWGKSPLGITLMALATVAAATSMGAFVAAFARDINQAAIIGTAFTIISGALGGNFIDYRAFTGALGFISKLTINRWSLEGFVNLTLYNLPLVDVLPNVAVLIGIGAVFFGLSLIFFNRRFVK